MTNIAKILENAPIGTKLYSPICGECTLDEIDYDRNVVVCDKSESLLPFYSDGTYNDNGECLLWPSKEHQSWDGWQEVLLSQSESFGCIFISKQNDKLYLNTKDGLVDVENPDNCPIIGTYSNTIRLLEYADIDKCENGFKTLERKGYHWNYETEELEELNSNFAVDDWICHNKAHDIRVITNINPIEGLYFTMSCADTKEVSNSIQYMNMNYHKWTIDDVKCGDILVSEYDAIFMANGKIESLYNGKTGPDFICSLSVHGDFDTIYDPFFGPFDDSSKPIPFATSSRPATYEERVKLFKSIADNHWKLCIDNMGNITGIEKIAEEPLEVVPTMSEDEIEAISKDSQCNSEQKFKNDLSEVFSKHNMDILSGVPVDALVDYFTENLKSMHILIQKERKAFYEQHKSIN